MDGLLCAGDGALYESKRRAISFIGLKTDNAASGDTGRCIMVNY